MGKVGQMVHQYKDILISLESPPAMTTLDNKSDANWSEAVEDLVDSGEFDKAISFLESIIESLPESDLQLPSALTELANLYSSKGFSLKSDALLSRASLIKLRADVRENDDAVRFNGLSSNGESSRLSDDDSLPRNESSDDLNDWEAIADHSPTKLIVSESLSRISDLSLEGKKGKCSKLEEKSKNVEGPKRRGRGTFSYRREELYSDRVLDDPSSSDEGIESVTGSKGSNDRSHTSYGTRHVLVLAGFSPSLRTTDLEKVFEDFRDHGVVIRWVNDTVALAVFRTPSIALEALKCTQCSFTVRLLDDDDGLLNSVPARDLQPPRPRPATSARTAKRLIAHGMGIKLPSELGSKEFRMQEEARKSRIITRQHLREDAWGDE